ncbi:shikimate dehydrogenase [Mesorhizobium sp. BAC0120]|uniref:shikimate dehydrogenase family protein n=1 Tax=Mesorhizobium sp. BAC0120 TaxID=3090670 RepID=UPI00298C5E2E|nr:shikimate dehydrogenase [Mesorhizobium sp. BAC0120]MDW6023823.1 shikimate dehydrogenase [Mesorhizobium sp. BAC0120]
MDTRRITGQTKIMLLMADPVSHVVGTEAITAFIRASGHDFICVPVHVGAQHLAAAIDALRGFRNCVGSGVTIPHKIPVLPLLDELTARARTIGSVNYIRRDPDGKLTGDNVDGSGFVRGAAEAGIELGGLRVLLLGAGGAGRSVAFALAEAGVAELVISNRNQGKALALVSSVSAAYPGVRVRIGDTDASGFDMVVNATSLGMAGKDDGDPVDLATLSSDMIVADIVMRPEKTRLLQAAEDKGCRLLFGRQMMDGQLALAQAFLGLT